MSKIDGVLEKVLAIVNTYIEDSVITADQADDDLIALGMNSISFISVVVALEGTFDIEYPDENLLIAQSNTVNILASIVSEALEKKDEEGAIE